MENSIIGPDREFIWQVLSEFFVDSEINCDYWADKISHFPLDLLKDIFFREVVPVCGPNVLTSIPPVWTAFDTDWVVSKIKENLTKRENSLMYRMRYDAYVIYYRIRCHDFWSDVENAITRSRAKQVAAGKPVQ